mmetsp:Transcript_29302/g.47034  ORF Transcript_29302/g.47034 Transcript_29302/m.47034 type:complete len:285 (+) Transcript_29302:282-1136(+)
MDLATCQIIANYTGTRILLVFPTTSDPLPTGSSSSSKLVALSPAAVTSTISQQNSRENTDDNNNNNNNKKNNRFWVLALHKGEWQPVIYSSSQNVAAVGDYNDHHQLLHHHQNLHYPPPRPSPSLYATHDDVSIPSPHSPRRSNSSSSRSQQKRGAPAAASGGGGGGGGNAVPHRRSIEMLPPRFEGVLSAPTSPKSSRQPISSRPPIKSPTRMMNATSSESKRTNVVTTKNASRNVAPSSSSSSTSTSKSTNVSGYNSKRSKKQSSQQYQSSPLVSHPKRRRV